MRELKLNVLPIFYPNISHSLITKLPSLFFLNEAKPLQIKKTNIINNLREYQNIVGDDVPVTVAFSD